MLYVGGSELHCARFTKHIARYAEDAVSTIWRDGEEKSEGCFLLCCVHKGPSRPSGVLGEVPLSDMGVVSLELVEEFVGRWEAAVGFADAWDSIYDEFLEAVVSYKVEEAAQEFVEEGAFVVLDKVGAGFACEGENKIRG